MRRSYIIFLVLCLIYTCSYICTTSVSAKGLPEEFVYVEDVIPDIQVELRYFSDHNFLGRRVDGYLAPKGILTSQAAEALKKVQEN